MPFDLNVFWNAEATEHKIVAEKTFATLQTPFAQWLAACETSVRNGGKNFFFGNGGSAADAQHLATELAVRYVKNRPAIPAIALTTDTSALTAIGNDFGFEYLFARQIEALGRTGDVAVGISTSGTSPNVLKALEQARKQGLITVGLTGGKATSKMNDYCDIVLPVPSETTARIQEMHITLGQMLCGALEQSLGYVTVEKKEVA
jgi:D-sedoheptulose 7-phosphate isomerase